MKIKIGLIAFIVLFLCGCGAYQTTFEGKTEEVSVVKTETSPSPMPTPESTGLLLKPNTFELEPKNSEGHPLKEDIQSVYADIDGDGELEKISMITLYYSPWDIISKKLQLTKNSTILASQDVFCSEETQYEMPTKITGGKIDDQGQFFIILEAYTHASSFDSESYELFVVTENGFKDYPALFETFQHYDDSIQENEYSPDYLLRKERVKSKTLLYGKDLPEPLTIDANVEQVRVMYPEIVDHNGQDMMKLRLWLLDGSREHFGRSVGSAEVFIQIENSERVIKDFTLEAD